MCLLVIAHRTSAELPLALVANRDEQYARATAPLQLWVDPPGIYGGRDLEQGGTWLGVTTSGRFAALTNFRSGPRRTGAESRGHVVLEYLSSSLAPAAYLAQLAHRAAGYGGFSVLAGELGGELYYFSNQGGEPRLLVPGLYGLSNQWLDSPWPKVVLAKQRVAALLAAGVPEPEALCDALLDRGVPPDSELPDTGVGLASERMLAPCFIAGERYGTRATSAIVVRAHGPSTMYERSFGPSGVLLGSAHQPLALR